MPSAPQRKYHRSLAKGKIDMLYPSLSSMLQQVNSRYLLVNIIARRAREISVGIGTVDGYPDDKPVSRAIEEIASGELRITIPDE
jgi:DNA-directed RNA polymerase subunit omega